jgi:hypothetical protein
VSNADGTSAPATTTPAAAAAAAAADGEDTECEMLLIATRTVAYGGAAGPLQTVRKIFPAACDATNPHTLKVIFVPNHELLAAARSRPTHALAAVFKDVPQLERTLPLVVRVWAYLDLHALSFSITRPLRTLFRR